VQNLWRNEVAVIHAIDKEVGGGAGRGISGLWWRTACIGSAMLWGLILIAFG
jgi:hypothetical protein